MIITGSSGRYALRMPSRGRSTSHEHCSRSFDGGLPSEILASLGTLVGCESASYTHVDHAAGRLLVSATEPREADVSTVPGLHAVFDQHPGLVAYQSGRLAPGAAAALSDLANARALRRLPLYVDFYLPRAAVDQLLCRVSETRSHVTVLSFNRSRRGFSLRDREIVGLVTPHLSLAVSRAERLKAMTAVSRAAARRTEQINRAIARLPALTPREREVVAHVADGATDHEIARALAISRRTVHKHLEQIYRKTGLGSRTSLMALVHGGGKPFLA
ncbi:response regulator transcription factor [Streptomyces sp. CA-135486]|uniref:helix-turn-helix transcriptional regulator n=1 Tax=Streptomyces sp. CA-135486 TaxID=3240049 RepID=UPI003D8DC221